MRRVILLLAVLLFFFSAPQVAAASPTVKIRLDGGTNFGSHAVGTTTARTVTITNTGSSTVYVGTIGVSSNDGAFLYDNSGTNTCHSGVGPYLEPGESCSYVILFSPQTTGTLTGTTDVGIDNESTILKLRGRGV